MALDTPRARIAHLLRRAGFGATETELSEYAALGFDGAVARLLDYDAVPEAADRVSPEQVGLQVWWLDRMLHTRRPLLEKMTLFWHGHLTSALKEVPNPAWMQTQNELLRAQALTHSYADLLRAISRDAAMIEYLDLRTNRKNAPNENYARELMELFTMGIGNYSEDDVKDAARAFTGWFAAPDGVFFFNRNQHDFGLKTVLGATGNLNGDDVSNTLALDPRTARYMSRKLFRYFAYPEPESEVIERLADTYLANGGSIRAVVAAILRSPEFLSERAYRALIKSPVELLIGTLRAIGAELVTPQLAQALKPLGQEVFNPPHVAGWFGGRSWINAASLLGRFNLASVVINQTGGPNLGGAAVGTLFQGSVGPDARVQRALDLLLDGDVTAEERTSLLAYASAVRGEEQVRGLLRLTMALPAYQLN